MQLSADTHHTTPIFVLATADQEPWHRVYGATATLRPGAWVFPAYYPLGLWALRDIEILTRRRPLGTDGKAAAAISEIRAADTMYQQIAAQYAAGRGVDLPLPSGWKWHKNPPYAHQRFGIGVGLTWWRHLYLWETGTGKTKAIVEGLRLRRALGCFGKALVECPRIVVPTWEREVAQHSDGELRTYHWQASDEDKLARAAAADVVVVTYQTVFGEAERALVARKALRLDDERARLLHQGRKVDYPELTTAQRAAHAAASVDPLTTVAFDEIYADESHCLATWESGQTRASLTLSQKAARRGALSGTAADRPMQLYPQLRYLAPGLLPMEYAKFLATHVVFHPANKHIVSYYKGMAGLNLRVDTIASRMKKETCLDLPPQVVIDVPYSLGLNQKARYNEIVKTLLVTTKPLANLARADSEDGLSPEQIDVLMEMPHGAARLGKVLQVTSGFIIKGADPTICDTCPQFVPCVEKDIRPYTRLCVVQPTPPPRELIRDFENPKLLVYTDLLAQLLDADPTNKVLCWANLTPELDDMEKVCRAAGIGYIRIDGKTTKNIAAMEDRFQNDPDCRVSIGIVSAGVGITLTAANYAIYYALPWKRIHYKQSLDRNNRPGQTRKMFVYRLIGNRTIEPAVAAVLAKKDDLAATLTDKIDCAACPHQLRCQAAKIRPFTDGCIYQSDAARPSVKVTEV